MAAASYAAYKATLDPAVWLRLNDPPGTQFPADSSANNLTGYFKHTYDNSSTFSPFAQNLCPNPVAYSNNITGWLTTPTLGPVTAGATGTLSSTSQFSGTTPTSLQLVTTAVAGEGAYIQLTAPQPGVPFLSGVTYQFDVYLKGNAGGETVNIALGNSASDRANSATLTLTTSFGRHGVTWTPTANETTVYAWVYTTAASIFTFFISGAQVSQVPSQTPAFTNTQPIQQGQSGALLGASDQGANQSTRWDGTSGCTVDAVANDNNPLLNTPQWSLEGWIKNDRNNAGTNVIWWSNGATVKLGYEFWVPNGATNLSAQIGAGNNVESGGLTNVLTIGTWAHAAATYDGQSIRIYCNGVLGKTITAGPLVLNVTSSTFIGCAGSSQFFSGWMQDLAMYPYALTDGQVALLYQLGAGLQPTYTVNWNLGWNLADSLTGAVYNAFSDERAARAAARLANSNAQAATPATSPAGVGYPSGNSGAPGRIAMGSPAETYESVMAATSNIVSWWKFGEVSGTLNDSVDSNPGTSSNVTYQNAGLVGSSNTCILTNGSNALVTVANAANLQLTGALSLECWYYPVATGITAWMIGKGLRGGNWDYALYVNSGGQLTLAITSGGQTVQFTATGGFLSVANQFYHLVGTWTGAGAEVWVNGVLEGSGSVTPMTTQTSSNTLLIGADSASGGNMSNGRIAHAAVYSAALEPSVIQAHYNAGITA